MVEHDNITNTKFNWIETLKVNVGWILMFTMYTIFILVGIMMVSKEFSNEVNKMMALIFILFFAMKIIIWIGHPKLIFTDIKKPNKKTIIHGY